MYRKRAFTLIEILIVAAIVAILAAILFPVLSSARESGRTTTCISNLRQIGQAIQLYTDANDAPPRHNSSQTWERQIGLAKFDSYNGSPGTDVGILVCPNHTLASNSVSSGYALNGCYADSRSVSDPANSVMVAETAYYETTKKTGGTGGGIKNVLNAPDIYESEASFRSDQDISARPIGQWGSRRHRGKGNYTMIDGHVATLAPDQFAVPKNTKACFADSDEWFGPSKGPTFALLTRGK